LIDKAGFGNDSEVYNRAISANYYAISESLESEKFLLDTLSEIKPFDFGQYFVQPSASKVGEQLSLETDSPTNTRSKESNEMIFERPESMAVPVQSSLFSTNDHFNDQVSENAERGRVGFLNSSKLRAQYAVEYYKGMQGMVGELSENLALNQRFMFTRELFDGNADLLQHALKSIDEAGSFEAAVELINSRFVRELKWKIDSEPVMEFIMLIYRKYCI
jgi:hypothetical protein